MAKSEVVRPHDLHALKRPLIEAAINAYMRKLNLDVEGESGFHGTSGSCDEGRFDFWIEDGHEGGEFYCDYPSGQWHQSRLLWDSNDHAGETVYQNKLFDAGAKYEEISELISSWIDPWINDCHSPNEFTNQINSIANVAKQLYVGDQIVFGSEGVTNGDSDAPTSGASAVSDLRSALDEMDLNVDDLGGVAIDALQRTYCVDIERTIGGQRGMATVAGLAITAEAMAWNETYISLRDFIKKATYDFNSYAGTQDSSGGDAVAALGAVAVVAGLAGGTIGVAFPPFGVAMAAVGGAVSIAALVFPTQEAVKTDPLVLRGDDFAAYWTSFTEQIVRINTDLRDAEDAIAAACQRMVNDYRSFPDNYSITATTQRGEQGPGDDLSPFMNTTIDFNRTKMRNVAGAIESVGDHQRALAGVLGGVDGAGNPSALTQSEWTRGSLPEVGTIGNGYLGPYDAFENLVNELVGLLIAESRTSHRVAEKCIDLSTDLQATDSERERELNKLSEQLDTIDIPVVNKPAGSTS